MTDADAGGIGGYGNVGDGVEGRLDVGMPVVEIMLRYSRNCRI